MTTRSMRGSVEHLVDGLTVVAALTTLMFLGSIAWHKGVQPWMARRPLPSNQWEDLVQSGRRVGPKR